jgi:CheY-like chemotaxis protein
MADDDEDDRLLARDAFEQTISKGSFLCVEDGNELLESLKSVAGEPGYLPDLILLDLNMPRKDGREALKEIKSFPAFRDIPVVVLTSSREEKDIVFSREMGANSFITKPVKFDHWIQMMTCLAEKWLHRASNSA